MDYLINIILLRYLSKEKHHNFINYYHKDIIKVLLNKITINNSLLISHQIILDINIINNF